MNNEKQRLSESKVKNQIKSVVFDEVVAIDDLVKYIYSFAKNKYGKYDRVTPVKLQKSLYFLYAYYSSFYANKLKLSNNENNHDCLYPEHLFIPENNCFEYWAFGPVIKSVHIKIKENASYYVDDSYAFQLNIDEKIKLFIDDLLKQTLNVSDFLLVERCFRDEVVQKCKINYNKIISLTDIRNEYLNKFICQVS